MRKRTKMKINISPVSLLWIAILLFSRAPYPAQTALAITLHELAHIFTARALGVRIAGLDVGLVGARIEMADTPSYGAELLIALAGPLSGMICGLPALIAQGHGANFLLGISAAERLGFFIPFCAISLGLGLFNLLPLDSLDGGRVLSALLHMTLPPYFADKIMRLATFFTLFAIWLLSVYLLIRCGGGLGMLVFCSIFFLKCFIFDAIK